MDNALHLVDTSESITRGLRRALDEAIAAKARLDEVEKHRDRLLVEVEMLKEQLKEACRARDFYTRHSMKIVTRLSDIAMLAEQMMQEAKDAAFAPSLAVPTPAEATPPQPELIEVPMDASYDNFATAMKEIVDAARPKEDDVPAFIKKPPRIK